jgi:hypothetical protein
MTDCNMAAESEEAPALDCAAEAISQEIVPGAEQATSQEIVPFALGKKRRAATAEADKEAKRNRPRWGDKAFEDISIGDVETIVRRCNALEKQVEANADAAERLKEAQKREKALNRQIEEYGPKEVSLFKAAIAKQLLAQMIYVYAWNDDLKEAGREIFAYLPNVSPELLQALGGDVNQTKTKMTKSWFDKLPSKSVPQPMTKAEKPDGNGLVLGYSFQLKYVKTSRELQIKAFYKYGACEKRVKGRGKSRKAIEGEAAIEDGADDDLEEDGVPEEGDDEASPEADNAVACEQGGA